MEKALPRVQALENQQPNNAYRRKVGDGHHHYQAIEGMDDQVSQGFGFQLDAINGITLTRGTWPLNRRLTIDGSGAAGPFEYDYIVDADYTGTEGATFPTSHGHTYQIYSTVQGAVDGWEAAGGDETILVVPGNYGTENVTIEPPDTGVAKIVLTTLPGDLTTINSLTMSGVFGLAGEGVPESVVENFKITLNLQLGSTTADIGRFMRGVHFRHMTVGGDLKFNSDTSTLQADYLTLEDCDITGGVDDNGKVVSMARLRFSRCVFHSKWDTVQVAGGSVSRMFKTLFSDCHLLNGIRVGRMGNTGPVQFDNCRIVGDNTSDAAFELSNGTNAAASGHDNLIFTGCEFDYTDHSSEWAFILIGKAADLGPNYINLAISGCTFNVPNLPADSEAPIHILWAPDDPTSGSGTYVHAALVGNAFIEDEDGNRMEDLPTTSRSYSVKGYFERSVFGPNVPADFEVELLGGTGNLYVGTGTVIGPGITASPGSDSDYFNGTFVETLDADISEAGGTVTLSLQQQDGGDLTMRFSDGLSILDCTPAVTIALTTDSDASPKTNYIYIPIATKVLTKSTTQWPATEHIKVGYYLIPSATFVSNNGPYVQQQWNDHRMGTNSQGHMAHMAERERLTAARYFSGINPAGTTSYLTIVDATVYYKATSGVIYQMHAHASPAVNTDPGGGNDKALVVNWNGTPFNDINNLFDIVRDSGNNLIGNNKWFNLVFWGVANKTGTYEPIMINLPSGFYNTQASAEQDISGHDNFDLPREFDLESSTAFLIARLTIKKQAGTWTFGSAVDLRRGDLLGARGGASSPETEFPDSTFNIFDATDNTKVVEFQLDQVAPNTTRTLTVPDASGTIALTTIGGGDFYIPLGMDIAGAPLTP